MKGTCLCDAIEYEADSPAAPIVHCHCRTCRKAHAAAFASTVGVKREQFRWFKGRERPLSYESSPGKLRHFCSACGSHLMAERSNQPNVIVRVAALDEDPRVAPEIHIWTSHDVPWLAYDGIPSYPEWPPDR